MVLWLELTPLFLFALFERRLIWVYCGCVQDGATLDFLRSLSEGTGRTHEQLLDSVKSSAYWPRENPISSAQLGIAVKTVETHRANFMLKLGLHSLAKLIHYAMRQGIIAAPNAQYQP
jgi:hypothetical protein